MLTLSHLSKQTQHVKEINTGLSSIYDPEALKTPSGLTLDGTTKTHKGYKLTITQPINH